MAGLVNRFGREKLMVLSPLALAATLIVFSLSSPIWMALLTYAFAGFFIRSNVLYRTTAQERTNLNFQGRVESIVGIVSSLIALLLFAAMGALQEFVSPRALYWLQSLILLAGILGMACHSFKTHSRSGFRDRYPTNTRGF